MSFFQRLQINAGARCAAEGEDKMAKNHGKDAYRTLVRVLIVLFVLTAICAAGYFLLDQSAKTQQKENEAAAQTENARLEEQYRQAKAEEEAKAEQGESIQWPTPKAQGWDVVDLSEFPLTNPRQLTVTRHDLLLGGMMLLNHWHSLPDDFPESDLISVHTSKNGVPVKNASVKLFPAAVTAVENVLAAAKEAGLEGYIIDEGYRTRETQQGYYDKEAANYSERLSGDALIEKVRQTVNYPGTSEYQSGFSFRVDRYKKDDKAFMDQKFKDMEQSNWLLAHSWEYGIIFRFPVQGYPNETVSDKSYKTGESKSLSIYRYVGKANAAVMHLMNFCMEEYIEYLSLHPHIAVYQDGVLKYEITRVPGGDTDITVSASASAKEIVASADNCGGVIVAMSY